VLGLSHDRILMYHGTPRADAAALERQLRIVSLAFPVLPLQELASGGKASRPRVALTFDDGLRNNVEVAYPILRKLGLSATFFVCPGLIDGDQWLWNHEARQRLITLNAGELGELAASMGAPAEVEAFVEWMKGLDIALRRKVEARIREATPRFAPSEEQRHEFDLARWKELKALDPRVVTIGSHTMTHPILTSLTVDETDTEMRESRFALEKRLEREVSLFCYPNGNLNDGALASARRYYRSAVTVEPGTVKEEADRHQLPRFAAHPRGMKRLVRRMVFG
jgi:peptidoglycan/xylan/chitin deacetylase (PgdA/CDA1 family)